MSIRKYLADKDNTISTAFKANLSSRASKANMGSSDILEIFSIFAQAGSTSLEKSRVLISFPTASIESDRTLGRIPASGSVRFVLKLSNAIHGQSTPEDYYITGLPILRDWTEGYGLDMESYLDEGPSNWLSASSGNPWYTTGSDCLNPRLVSYDKVPLEYKLRLEKGTEDIELDITGITESWLSGVRQKASASIELPADISNYSGSFLTMYTYEGEKGIFKFVGDEDLTSSPPYYFIKTGPLGSRITAAALTENIYNSVVTSFSNKIVGSFDGPSRKVIFTQSAGGFYGNTKLIPSVPGNFSAIDSYFAGGHGAPNYGFLLKLSGSYEDGSKKKSFYTKKMFARSSQFFFKRPAIEARWDSSVKDNRGGVNLSSSLSTEAENLQSIYFRNHSRGGLVNIPKTGSGILVQFFTSSAITDKSRPIALKQGGGVVATGDTYITGSRKQTGLYEIQFQLTGSRGASRLYDHWYRHVDASNRDYIHAGPGFEILTRKGLFTQSTPSYVTKITNLKPNYSQDEKVTMRLYTRDKNWKPNIYTKARASAPVSNIESGFYKIIRVSDNLTIIPYSTGSSVSYSSLSHDSSGSYFDIDMSILEPNYQYEISILSKEGSNYVEQKEKFRFRVEK